MQLIFATWSPLQQILTEQYLEVVWKVWLSFLPSAAHFGFCSVKSKLLSALAFLLVLMGTAQDARAVTFPYPAVMMYRATYSYSGGFTGPWQATVPPACDDFLRLWMAYIDKTKKYELAYCEVSTRGFKIQTLPGVVPSNSYNSTISQGLACPNGGILKQTSTTKGTCEYDANFPPPGPDCSDKNPMIRRFNYGAGPYTTPDHFGECVVEPVELLVCRKENGSVYCMWTVKRTGEVYKGTDVPGSGAGGEDKPDVPTLPSTTSPPIVPKPDPGTAPNAVPCPKGSVQAGVNSDGVPICVGTGTKPPAPPVEPEKTTSPPVTTNNPDGSSVTVVTTTQKNLDGSTTTTTRTTTRGVDGSETVKTDVVVGKTPTGSEGSTDTPERDQYDLCKQNPTLAVCRNSSVSGSCGEITCQGDAIQCATLRAAAAMQCAQKADEDALKASPQTSLGNAVLSGADPMQADISTMLKGTEVDLSKPALDSSGFLAGGSCLPNKSFTVAGRAVTVEFTTLCDNIQPLRAVIMACAFIAAYMLVARSVVQS